MPIRSSITDPDGQSVKEFARLKREGPLPKTPDRKPLAAERDPVLRALQGLPINQNFPSRVWIDKYSMPYLTTKFVLWGIEFAVYPISRSEHNDTKTCTGGLIKAITRNRRGVQPMFSLNGPYANRWYREILDWISEQFYDGQ